MFTFKVGGYQDKRPTSVQGSLLPLPIDQEDIVVSTTQGPEIITVLKTPALNTETVHVEEVSCLIETIQDPAVSTEEKVLNIIQNYESNGPSFTQVSQPQPDNLFPPEFSGTNTIISPNQNSGDTLYCTIQPQDIINIIKIVKKVVVKSGIEDTDNIPKGVVHIALNEPKCWEVIKQFRKDYRAYPWELTYRPDIHDDWISYIKSIQPQRGYEREIAECGGREKPNTLTWFKSFGKFVNTIADALVNIPSPDPILEAIKHCILRKKACVDSSEDEEDEKAEDLWSSTPVTFTNDFNSKLNRFATKYIRTYINRRYSSGVIARWYCQKFKDGSNGVKVPYFELPKQNDKCERVTPIIRKVYLRVDDVTEFTYDDISFQEKLKAPISDDSVNPEEEPSTLLHANKNQLLRFVRSSPWAVQIRDELSTYENTKELRQTFKTN